MDIKIENLVMNDNNELMLIDFGLIKNIDSKTKYINKYNYNIWPKKPCDINKIPVYSIFILIVSLLVHEKYLYSSKNNFFNILKDKLDKLDKNIFFLFNKGLSLEYDSKKFKKKFLLK